MKKLIILILGIDAANVRHPLLEETVKRVGKSRGVNIDLAPYTGQKRCDGLILGSEEHLESLSKNLPTVVVNFGIDDDDLIKRYEHIHQRLTSLVDEILLESVMEMCNSKGVVFLE